MVDQYSYPYDVQQNAQPTTQQSPLFNIVLTPEEIKILNECRHNAIVTRGIPMAATVVAGHYYMIKKGLLPKNIPGMMIGGIVGFFVGTVSYRQICMEKLLSLPNSTLKDRILAAQGVQPQVRVDINSGDSFFESILPSSDPPQDSSLNMEPYQSNQLDSYDYHPIDAETTYAVNPPLQPAQRETFITYDELRHHNRNEYYKSNSMQSGPRGPAPSSSFLYSPPSLSNAPPQSSPYSSNNDSPPESAESFNRTSEQRPHGDRRW